MEEMKHTAGPWMQDKYGNVQTPSGNTLVTEGVALGGCSTEETRANARLIAAAPELLDAHEPDRTGPDFLDWVADRLVMRGDNPDADFVLCLRRRAEKARVAIAKANGQSK